MILRKTVEQIMIDRKFAVELAIVGKSPLGSLETLIVRFGSP
jgi:hypothetical protein